MQEGQPSRTAWGAAVHRAAHQVLERGFIFTDPLAVRILGAGADEAIESARNNPWKARLRLFIAVRTRFAEDALSAAVQRGATQLVILGAGLDTYAYRTAFADRLRIFEVDHPATQVWKRERMAEAGIRIPPHLTFAPVDFEKETLTDGLHAAGFDPMKQTFFTWLGVVPYLTEEAVFSTLSFVAGIRSGAHVVFDYANPPDPGRPEFAAAHDLLAARVAAVGEAFKSYFEADTVHAKLRSIGFREIEDLGPIAIRKRYFPKSEAVTSDCGGHILRATTVQDSTLLT